MNVNLRCKDLLYAALAAPLYVPVLAVVVPLVAIRGVVDLLRPSKPDSRDDWTLWAAEMAADGAVTP